MSNYESFRLAKSLNLFVVLTKRWFIFSFAYRYLYKFASFYAQFTFSRMAGVAAVYDRVKLPLKIDIGVSDIDLTVIIDDKAGDSLAVMKNCFLKFQKVQRILPLIRDLEVMTESELSTQIALGPPATSSMKQYSRIFPSKRQLNFKNSSTSLDYFQDAIFRYVNHMTPGFLRAGEPIETLQKSRMLHNVECIRARLDKVLADPSCSNGSQSPLDYQIESFYSICAAAQALETVESSPPDVINRLTEISSPKFLEELVPGNFCQLDCEVRVGSSFMNSSKALMFVVTPDSITPTQLREVLEGLKGVYRKNTSLLSKRLASFPTSCPMILSKSAFEMFVVLYPFETMGVAFKTPTKLDFWRSARMRFLELRVIKNDYAAGLISREHLMLIANQFACFAHFLKTGVIECLPTLSESQTITNEEIFNSISKLSLEIESLLLKP